MSSVVKKKKKTLLEKIFRKIKPELFSNAQRDIDCNIPFYDIRTESGDIATIASRRNELKSANQCNFDAMVIFNDNKG